MGLNGCYLFWLVTFLILDSHTFYNKDLEWHQINIYNVNENKERNLMQKNNVRKERWANIEEKVSALNSKK